MTARHDRRNQTEKDLIDINEDIEKSTELTPEPNDNDNDDILDSIIKIIRKRRINILRKKEHKK